MCIFPALLPAGARADLTEEAFFIDAPVVLSAARLRQPIEQAPSAVTVISREMIVASGARDVPELLRLVPGFVVGMPDNFRAATSQHGLTSSLSRRMQVLVDGRSVASPVFGGVQWFDIPLPIEDIERIEVVRGPNASSYGASAMLGVINITTRHAAEHMGLQSVARIGSNNIVDGYLSQSGSTGKLDWRLSLKYQHDEGMSLLDDKRTLTMATLRTDHQYDKRNLLLAQAGFNHSPRNVDSFNPDVPLREQVANNYFGQLRWEHTRSDGGHFWVQAYHSVSDVDQPFQFYFVQGGTVVAIDDDPLFHTAKRTDIEFEDSRQLSHSARLVWGGGLRLDQIDSEWAFGTTDDIDDHYYRLFGNIEWRTTDMLTVNLGGMYEHHDFTGDAFSPRLAFNYRVAPGHVIRLGAAKATRVPVAYEELANLVFSASDGTTTYVNPAYVSSGGLAAETITSYEIGYLGHFLHGRLDLDARIYHESLDNLIAQQRIADPTDLYNGFYFDYTSRDDATVRGAELQLDYRVSSKHFYRLAYGYTNVNSSNIAQNLSDSAPEHLLTLFGAFPLPRGLQGSAAYYYSSGHTYLTDFDSGLGGEALDPIHRVDLRLAYPFRYGRSSNEVALVVQSALGDYNEFQNKNEYQRRIWLEMRLDMPR